MKDRYSDDIIFEALVSSPTIPAAAEKVGCNVSAIYRRLQRPAFRQRVAAYRVQALSDMLEELQAARLASFRLLLDVLESDFEDTNTRLRAAALILQHTKALDNIGTDTKEGDVI